MTGRTEPHADIRQAAGTLWQMHVALQEQGFTPTEALTIVAAMAVPRSNG